MRKSGHRHPSRGPKTSWEKVSRWYGAHLEKEGTYQDEVVYPGALKLLALRDGEKLLDIACGEGAFSRRAAKAARVRIVGFDAAPSLVGRARKLAPKGADYLVANATDFARRLPEHGFDAAACILALQNMKDYEPVIRDAAKALKPGGRLVLALNHPCFRVPRQSGWGWDETRKLQYRRVDMYLSPLEVPIQAHPGSAPEVKTFSYHRPLQDYVAALARHGFAIDALEEWTSHRKSEGGRARAEDAARKEIPLFLALRAVKSPASPSGRT